MARTLLLLPATLVLPMSLGFATRTISFGRRLAADFLPALEQFVVDHQARIVSFRRARILEFLASGCPGEVADRVMIRSGSGLKRDAWLFQSWSGFRVVWIDEPGPDPH